MKFILGMLTVLAIQAATVALSNEIYLSWSVDEKILQFNSHIIEIDRPQMVQGVRK